MQEKPHYKYIVTVVFQARETTEHPPKSAPSHQKKITHFNSTLPLVTWEPVVN